MRKEVIGAIILGLILGTVIVAGYYRANQAKQTEGGSNQPSPTPIADTANSELLTITNPSDGDIFSSPTATVSGATLPDARIVIISENEQLFLKPSANGYFSQEIQLDGGVNRLQITAVSPTGQRADKTLDLVFTRELDASSYDSNR